MRSRIGGWHRPCQCRRHTRFFRLVHDSRHQRQGTALVAHRPQRLFAGSSLLSRGQKLHLHAPRLFASPGRRGRGHHVLFARGHRVRLHVRRNPPYSIVISHPWTSELVECACRISLCITLPQEELMRWTLLCLAMTLALSGSLAVGEQSIVTRLDGSTITSSELDGTVTRLMKAAEVTGVGIAIFNNGKIAHLKAYGLRDKEKNLPLTVDSVMSAASFSKVAFAYLAMELVGEGILDLDKP